MGARAVWQRTRRHIRECRRQAVAFEESDVEVGGQEERGVALL
jgi:hypothetical protein